MGSRVSIGDGVTTHHLVLPHTSVVAPPAAASATAQPVSPAIGLVRARASRNVVFHRLILEMNGEASGFDFSVAFNTFQDFFVLAPARRAPHLVLRSTYFQRQARGTPPQCPPRGRAARWVTSSGADTAQTAVLSVLAIDSDLKTKTHREFRHPARPMPLHALTSSTRRVQNRSRIIVGPSGRGAG